MENENACVFSLISRLCEKILDESWKHNDRSTSRTLRIKKLRTKAYGTLLIPGNNEFPHSPHECFVKVISTAFASGTLQDNICLEEFDDCIDQLWQESRRRTYIPPMVYFLAKMCNERQNFDVDENENVCSNGISSSIVPRKYHLYHPSSFILPNLHNALSSTSTVNGLPSSQFLQSSSVVRPVCNFQFDIIGSKFPGKKIKHSPSAFPSIGRNQSNMIWNHLEDEGYESTGTTPLVTTPAEPSALPWYELDLDFNSNQKVRHRTWESLGEPAQALEHPPLFEAGIEALHCNLKIQEKLLLTLEPRISLKFRDPINWKTLLHHVMCLLMGMESESFIFNEELDRFELMEGIWLEDISHEALSACLADIIVMGSCFRRLLSFVESENGQDQGVVLKEIRKCTRNYLHLYQGVCLLLMHDLLQRKPVSILLMRLKLRSLQEQILCLARAYGLWGSGPPLPIGVEALSHLHRHASSAQRQQVAALFHYILHAACLVYFSILERWVFDGEVIDGGDFFVVARLDYLSCRNRRFWTRAFQCNSATVPDFLCGLKPFLLRCGKSVNFLKRCDPMHPSLETGQSLLASLKQTYHPSLGSEELIQESVDDMKVCAGNSFEESKVCIEKKENQVSKVKEASVELIECTSCEKMQEPNQKSDFEHPVPLEVDAKEQDEDILKTSEWEPFEGMVMEKVIEEEKKKLIEYYEKLGEASDRRRLKAEWRSRRMMLRTGDSASCGIAAQEKPDCDKNVLNKERLSVKESSKLECQEKVLNEDRLPVKEPFERECLVDEVAEDAISPKEGIEESRDALKDLNEVDVEQPSVEMEGKDNPRVEETECVALTSEEKVELKGSEEAMRETVKVKIVNPIAEIESNCMEEGAVGQIKEEKVDTEEGIHQSCISDVPSSNVCLPFLKSPNLPPEWPYRSVLLALMVQSSKMDAALLQWMLVEKGLVSHLRSLRAYFFLLDGEFGRRLSEDLFSAMRRAPGGKPSIECLNEHSLSRILSHALASSTFAASDPNAGLLYLTLNQCPENAQVGDPLACVHMQYVAPWPLNVVLTEEAVSKYSRVLDLLLRLRHASWALEQTFLHLRVLEPGKGIDKVFPRRWRSPHEAVQNSPQ
ncbi:hypothetical protein J437_LFUL010291, partial [Ladona fulva]